MADVVIIGGGVIGLSLAYELAGQGTGVVLLERGEPGQEASWAGAGILPPGNTATARTPEARLRAESHLLWPELSRQLFDETGVDNGYRNCGGIEVRVVSSPAADDGLQHDIDVWREEEVDIDELDAAEVHRLEPRLSHQIDAAYRLPDLCQVRNPRHLKALIAGCAARGVKLLGGTPVTGFTTRHGRVLAAKTPQGTVDAGCFVIAGGAWSQSLLAEAGAAVPLDPVRGQMVLLSAMPLPVAHVIQHGSRYIVPRPDGRILIGSTEEHAGFDKRNTAEAVAELVRFGVSLVPSLALAKFERAWAGLRPCSVDGLPYLGLVPNHENLYVAAGHFRAGLQMSPATALVMRQLILGQKASFPLDGLECDRYRTNALPVDG